MLNPLNYIATTLANDSSLASLMNTSTPNPQVFIGDVDIVRETQTSLQYPMIVVHTVSDIFRVMPLNGRDMHIQIDIIDRTSELEVVNIYEQVCSDLTYMTSVNQGTKIWWTRADGGADESETEMRIFHIKMSVIIYYYDNSNE
jgi:hypothetical protein